MSKWFVGSSNINSEGSFNKSLARAILICHPPENSEQGLPISEGLNPNPCNTVSTRERNLDSSASSSLRTTSPIVKIASEYSGEPTGADRRISSASSRSLRNSKTSAKADSTSSYKGRLPATMASCGRYPTVAYLGFIMHPESNCSSPAMTRKRVVFPAPLEPTSPILSPLFTTTVTESKIFLAPYAKAISFSSIILLY